MSQSNIRSTINRWSLMALVALALTIFGTPRRAEATTVIPMDVAELSDQAELVFTGTAVQTNVVLSGDGVEPYTFVTFTVQDVLKGGTPGRQITLRFSGGQLAQGGVTYEGMPQFERGETYLIFVHGNGSLHCPVLGWWQGHYRFSRQPGSAKRTLVDHAGAPLQGIEEGHFKRARPQHDAAGVTVVSEQGVHVVVENRAIQATSTAPDADHVIEQLRSFIAARKTARTFQPGKLVQSARVEDVPAHAALTPARPQ